MSLETFGNEKSMNLDNVLLTNIQSSLYFKNLYQKKTYHEVLEEIKRNVEILSPYIPNTKTPSTAYCLLYKFFLMKLTVKQMTGLLGNKDSPYVRAIGALYLRYCHPPANLWDWYVDYLEDYDTILISKTNEVTVQKFLFDLLKDNKFSGTVLPRIPTKIQQDLDKKIKEYEFENNLTTNNNSASKYGGSKDNSYKSSSSSYRDGGRDNYRDSRDSGRNRYNDRDSRDSGRDRDNYRDNYRDRDNSRYNDSYRKNNNKYSDDDSSEDEKPKERNSDPYRDELERYKNERSRGSIDRDHGSSRNYSSSRDGRDNYDRDNRDRGSVGSSRRYDDDDNRSYHSSSSSYNKKRSRSRSNSRDRDRSNSRDRNNTTSTTTTIEPPKEESENLKKLRSLYGATSDKVSLD